MGSEYFINSQDLENKVRQLLPSQGGAGAGFDLSASTQIIPVIDLTESAEGSNVREDLQTALSFSSITSFQVFNATTTIINNTGYYRVIGSVMNNSGNTAQIRLTDGASNKVIYDFSKTGGAGTSITPNQLLYDFNVFLSAGISLVIQSSDSNQVFNGCTRQIADIDGNLVNP